MAADAESTVTLYAVRHAEKDSGPNPPLTAEGHARAEALVGALADVPVELIYSSDYRRCQETVAPLARAKSLTPEVIEAADPHRQIEALHGLPAGTVALLCGHANTVPMLVQVLGGVCPDLQFGMIPESTYDRLFKVTYVAGGSEPTRTTVEVSRYGEP